MIPLTSGEDLLEVYFYNMFKNETFKRIQKIIENNDVTWKDIIFSLVLKSQMFFKF